MRLQVHRRQTLISTMENSDGGEKASYTNLGYMLKLRLSFKSGSHLCPVAFPTFLVQGKNKSNGKIYEDKRRLLLPLLVGFITSPRYIECGLKFSKFDLNAAYLSTNSMQEAASGLQEDTSGKQLSPIFVDVFPVKEFHGIDPGGLRMF